MFGPNDWREGVAVLLMLSVLLRVSLVVAERYRLSAHRRALNDHMERALRQNDHEQWAVYYGEWNRRYGSKQPTTPVVDTRGDSMHFERERASLDDRSGRNHFASAVAVASTPSCTHDDAVDVLISTGERVARWCPDCSTQITDPEWVGEPPPQPHPWTCHDCPHEDVHPHPSRHSAQTEAAFQRAQRALRDPNARRRSVHDLRPPPTGPAPGARRLDHRPAYGYLPDVETCATCDEPYYAHERAQHDHPDDIQQAAREYLDQTAESRQRFWGIP